MAQQLRVLVVLRDNWSFLSSTHVRQLTTTCKSSYRGSETSSHSHAHTHIQTHTYLPKTKKTRDRVIRSPLSLKSLFAVDTTGQAAETHFSVFWIFSFLILTLCGRTGDMTKWES